MSTNRNTPERRAYLKAYQKEYSKRRHVSRYAGMSREERLQARRVARSNGHKTYDEVNGLTSIAAAVVLLAIEDIKRAPRGSSEFKSAYRFLFADTCQHVSCRTCAFAPETLSHERACRPYLQYQTRDYDGPEATHEGDVLEYDWAGWRQEVFDGTGVEYSREKLMELVGSRGGARGRVNPVQMPACA